MCGMDAGRIVRAARRARRVSQRELAVLADVPRSTVERIEAGRPPTLGTVACLLQALGFELAAVDEHGQVLAVDDEHDRLRDAAGRRFPAHLRWARTPDYVDVSGPDWWGWHRIAWPFGPGKPPPYTFWQRPRQ
jgi:transcriptional regulator with XRE-family HTH domain